MINLSESALRQQGKQPQASTAFMYVGLIVGILFFVAISSGVYFALEAAFGNQRTPSVAHAAQIERHVHANMNIVINQPGYHKDWPAFAPGTVVVPANSLVTLTIRNYDLGDTPLPKGSPFSTVQGIVGNVAYADGHAFTALALEKVSHTFTIPLLNINVPLPGDSATGKPYSEVTFTFRTGAAGSYYFRCFDPCGIGSIGWEGPMMTKGYMLGTLTVK
jgi:prepilin-type processing-associated H-X9-DG protein